MKKVGSITLTALNLIWPGAALLWRNQIPQAIGYGFAFAILNVFRSDIGSMWAIYVWLLAQIHFQKVRDLERFRHLTRIGKSVIWLSTVVALFLYSVMYGPFWTHSSEIKEPILLFSLVLLALSVPGIILTCWLAPRKMTSSTPLGSLESRLGWKELPASFLRVLASKFDSAEAALELADCCERSGILKRNILRPGIVDSTLEDDHEFALGAITATLTSYANALGDAKKFDEAGRALRLALTLRPGYMPAWASMALVNYYTGNCPAAVFWANKVLGYSGDPNGLDPWKSAAARSTTPEGERSASEALGDPTVMGNSEVVQQQMRAIKEACGRHGG